MTEQPASVLSAADMAPIREWHFMFEAKYHDDDGRIILRERRCAHCDEDWPCDIGLLLTSHAAVVAERDYWQASYAVLHAQVSRLEEELGDLRASCGCDEF